MLASSSCHAGGGAAPKRHRVAQATEQQQPESQEYLPLNQLGATQLDEHDGAAMGRLSQAPAVAGARVAAQDHTGGGAWVLKC